MNAAGVMMIIVTSVGLLAGYSRIKIVFLLSYLFSMPPVSGQGLAKCARIEEDGNVLETANRNIVLWQQSLPEGP